MTEISLIIPVMNEEKNIGLLLEKLETIMSASQKSYEYLFIEGGSEDGTLNILREKAKTIPQIKIISLSKSFGKEASLLCGFDYARGKAAIPIDADLQDPPEIIPEFIKKWEEGNQMVYGVRKARKDSFLKNTLSSFFYKIYNLISDYPIPYNAGDYRLLDRSVIEALKNCRERNLFMKGLFGWVGFKTDSVEFDRPKRNAGNTGLSYKKLWTLALDGIFSASTLPLRIWTYLGAIIAVFSAFYAFFIITKTLILGKDTPGYASLAVLILFFGALQMVSVGILGEYIGRIYKEAKQRPNYIIDKKFNI